MKPVIFQLNLSMPYQQISKSIQIINHDNQLEWFTLRIKHNKGNASEV